MYLYQTNSEYYAQISDGLEELGRKELTWLGVRQLRAEHRGFHFKADHETLYRVNYKSRLFTRVLAPLVSFPCHDEKKLYDMARSIEWSDFISETGSFAVFAHVSDSKINNSHFASLKVKDAIVDQFRDKTGIRPNVDTKFPDVWFNLHIRKNRAVLSLDTSGGSLHRRGYRRETVEAPMQETVAAASLIGVVGCTPAENGTTTSSKRRPRSSRTTPSIAATSCSSSVVSSVGTSARAGAFGMSPWLIFRRITLPRGLRKAASGRAPRRKCRPWVSN